ncbi:MAG: polyphosphate kinase 1 [Bdellovibrionaceae bacterium]|nr:polyphosphate kinase 1 [Pseudobdellovibrionaceae bacterium]
MVLKRKIKKKTRKKISRKGKKPGASASEAASALSSTEFLNREVGWLQFNFRVLNEAKEPRNPLLERLRFLSISSSNLDEFVMKRIGRLKKQEAYNLNIRSKDGLNANQQLAEIRMQLILMIQSLAEAFKTLRAELAKEEIFLEKWKDLSESEKTFVREFYLKNVFPVLTPLSVDLGHPFPFISNLSTSLGVTLRHPEHEERLFARVKIPKVLPQWIRVDPNQNKFISLIDVIIANVKDLFPLMDVLNVMPFRLTRNAELEESNEEDAEDLLEHIEEELRQRRFAEVVRLEHGPNPDAWMLQFLLDELELSQEDVYEHPGLLDYTDLNVIFDVPRTDLKYRAYSPVTPGPFLDDSQSLFTTIRQQELLLHHPYESFRHTVERFVKEASVDSKVLAIKMTLYRTGDNSPFVKALIRAAEEGKQVVCLVELKARFDEERNIYWAQALENAGVHVVYGVIGLKTHAKTILIVRQETEGLKCYAHIGTGNYNSATSRLYSDFGLLTSRDEITAELVEFFHYLTGRSLKNSYQHLLVAPINMASKFTQLIDREGDHAKHGRPSQIIAKFNNMDDAELSRSLYRASQNGTPISLIVRGFCCLKPGVPGMSERIKVISIIGRFLEHSRVFYFRNGAADPLDGDFFIGSADWMYRNLHTRVEAIVPITDRSSKEKLWEVLQISLVDGRQAWDMSPDGKYTQRKTADVGIHAQLMNLTKQRQIHMDEGGEKKES